LGASAKEQNLMIRSTLDVRPSLYNALEISDKVGSNLALVGAFFT